MPAIIAAFRQFHLITKGVDGILEPKFLDYGIFHIDSFAGKRACETPKYAAAFFNISGFIFTWANSLFNRASSSSVSLNSRLFIPIFLNFPALLALTQLLIVDLGTSKRLDALTPQGH